MLKIIDARGRSCPEPVIMTKKEISGKIDKLTVLVDTNVAVENITRYAEGQGYKVNVTDKDEEFEISIER